MTIHWGPLLVKAGSSCLFVRLGPVEALYESCDVPEMALAVGGCVLLLLALWAIPDWLKARGLQ